MLKDIDGSVIEKFEPWRIKRIKTRKSDGKSTVTLNLMHLHCVFAFAVEKGFMDKNPVPSTSRTKNPDRGAQPYSADELRDLMKNADDDLFLVLFLRWTGFRRSDAAILLWREVHFDRQEIEHVCKKTRRKTGKKVILPISAELLTALKTERDRRKPQPNEPVLLNSATGKPFDKPHLRSNNRSTKLYDRIVALGKRAGVRNAHPHRFRDTFAVDMLLRTDNVAYVAALLGDTIKTVEDFYIPYVRELREGARLKIANCKGIEQFETPTSQEKDKAA